MAKLDPNVLVLDVESTCWEPPEVQPANGPISRHLRRCLRLSGPTNKGMLRLGHWPVEVFQTLWPADLTRRAATRSESWGCA